MFVYDLKGNIATTPCQISQAHKENFTCKLGGMDIDFDSLLREHRGAPTQSQNVELEISEDSLNDLVRKIHPNKAPGNDRIQYEVFKSFPFLLRHIASISNRCMSGDIPLQWNGAIIQEIFKGVVIGKSALKL